MCQVELYCVLCVVMLCFLTSHLAAGVKEEGRKEGRGVGRG